MENNPVIDTWIFEYLSHKCIQAYYHDGCNSVQLRKKNEIVLGYVTAYLNGEDRKGTTRRENVCLLFLHLLCMEESLIKDEFLTNCDYIIAPDFRKSVSHTIAFASRDTKNENTKKLARKCLIETYIVFFKCCFTNNTEKEALDDFRKFSILMPTEECKEMYDKCVSMTSIDPNDDFISDYLELIRHLVLSLYSELGDPILLELAKKEESGVPVEKSNSNQEHGRNSTSTSDITDNNENPQANKNDETTSQFTPALQVLLGDRRPSKLADLEEIRLEESDALTRMRKKTEMFDTKTHLQNVVKLHRRVKRKPPSHQTARLGAWMPEEEMEFIRATLKIGAGHWTEIKATLGTIRSGEQLRYKWRQIKQWRIDQVRLEMEDSGSD